LTTYHPPISFHLHCSFHYHHHSQSALTASHPGASNIRLDLHSIPLHHMLPADSFLFRFCEIPCFEGSPLWMNGTVKSECISTESPIINIGIINIGIVAIPIQSVQLRLCQHVVTVTMKMNDNDFGNECTTITLLPYCWSSTSIEHRTVATKWRVPRSNIINNGNMHCNKWNGKNIRAHCSLGVLVIAKSDLISTRCSVQIS